MPHDGYNLYRWARDNHAPPFFMNFDTAQNSKEYLMSVNGLSVGLNMPPALKSIGKGESEVVHSLPPYRPRRVFLVDEYPACPEKWMRSNGRTKSYFVPVRTNAGLWLDFNSCFGHTNHVAIVVSIQGVNAVTGLPCKDPQLERYMDECPKHKKAFGPDRFCKACNFRWPRQNYIPGNVTPQGSLWLDGFRAEDGVIRQYVFTAEKMRGVAAAVIGEDRVFALGISYFLSKEAKPPQPVAGRRGWSYDEGHCGIIGSDTLGTPKGLLDSSNVTTSWGACAGSMTNSVESDADGGEKSVTYSASLHAPKAKSSGMKGQMLRSAGRPQAAMSMSAPVQKINNVQQLEVAAGARINQQIWDDPSDLEFWQKEPEGLIVINYCTEEDAEKIIAAGKVDLSGNQEGFLQKVPTGNP